jgi:hypothetical protein
MSNDHKTHQKESILRLKANKKLITQLKTERISEFWVLFYYKT